jgi:hypothetical protein
MIYDDKKTGSVLINYKFGREVGINSESKEKLKEENQDQKESF